MSKSIGIDLGTTTTIVSYTNKKGHLSQLRYEGETLIPSVLYFKTKQDYIVGKKAKKAMRMNPAAGIANFKRRMGDRTDVYEVTAENGDTFRISGEAAAEKFLDKLIEKMNGKIEDEYPDDPSATIENVVITVPAKFNSVEVDATKRAAHDCALDDVHVAAEPTAAAVAVIQENEQNVHDGMTVLVYDFGGGTFDVSVIQQQNGAFQEIATNGDKNLGGNDLTERIVDRLRENIEDQYGVELPEDPDDVDDNVMSYADYQQNMQSIRDMANSMKEELSSETEASDQTMLYFKDGMKPFEVTLRRKEFENFIREDIKRTIDITMRTIDEARKAGIETIDQVVLAGGSSAIPLIQEELEKRLENVNPGEDASYLISAGASMLAEHVENLETMTTAISNAQLGVEVYPRRFQALIPENVALPYSGSHTFRLARDGQQKLQVPCWEYDVKNHPGAQRVDEEGMEQIDTILISDLPPNLKKAETQVKVTFTEQLDGSLKLEAELVDMDGKTIRSGVKAKSKASNVE